MLKQLIDRVRLVVAWLIDDGREAGGGRITRLVVTNPIFATHCQVLRDVPLAAQKLEPARVRFYMTESASKLTSDSRCTFQQ